MRYRGATLLKIDLLDKSQINNTLINAISAYNHMYKNILVLFEKHCIVTGYFTSHLQKGYFLNREKSTSAMVVLSIKNYVIKQLKSGKPFFVTSLGKPQKKVIFLMSGPLRGVGGRLGH